MVDVSGLDYICSAGLGVLVHALKRTRAQGGDLPLAAAQGAVRKMLTVTGLINVFTVYPSVGQALRGGEAARRLAASRTGGGAT